MTQVPYRYNVPFSIMFRGCPYEGSYAFVGGLSLEIKCKPNACTSAASGGAFINFSHHQAFQPANHQHLDCQPPEDRASQSSRPKINNLSPTRGGRTEFARCPPRGAITLGFALKKTLNTYLLLVTTCAGTFMPKGG